ncbi:MAG: hypothetical protein IJ688_07065 [Treponema sp.]|nr:hypothetical protein [Treponema sp.]
MKKILYSITLTLFVFSFFGCAELAEIQKAVSSVSNVAASNKKDNSNDEQLPNPDDETLAFFNTISEKPNNYWIPKTESSENPPRLSYLIGTKDLNILLEDLSKNNFEKIYKNTDLADPTKKAMLDAQMLQVFGMYSLGFNDGRGSPINFCVYDMKYNKECTTHNGWESGALIFHATFKQNIYGNYDVDEFEYYMYELK